MREILTTLARLACERATHADPAERLAYLSDLSDAYAGAGDLS